MSSTEEIEKIVTWTEEEQSPEEKRHKFEPDHPFYNFLYDRDTYMKGLNDHSLVDCDDVLQDEDSDEFSEEEAEKYFQALDDTDGFDVPDFPEVSFCGMIIPLPVDEDSHDKLFTSSVASIQFFNRKYGTNYKVVKVEKAMHQGACGIHYSYYYYYITFQAKIDDDKNSDTTNSGDDKSDDNNSGTTRSDDDNSDTTKTFEAMVLMGSPKKKGDDAKVIFCREKGGPRVAEEKLKSNDEEGASVEEAEEGEDEGGSVEEEAEGTT